MAKKATAKRPEEYERIKREMEKDRASCSVVAIAAIAKVSGKTAQEALSAVGRKRGHGTYKFQTRKALELLGFKVTFHDQPWIQENIINRYPARHQSLQHVTTHHPRRFKRVWSGLPDMLLFTTSHVAACVDGKVIDWSISRSLHVTEVWTIEKIK